MIDRIKRELDHRMGLWTELHNSGGPRGVSPNLLRELGIYRGAQGIWIDKNRTGEISEDGRGITVGLLHTGKSYPDDLSEDGVIYHYPKTNRPSTRDLSEIAATKAAGSTGLPVFVITYPSPGSSRRNVHFGWVEGWDDESKLFLVTFEETKPSRLFVEVDDDEPFQLVSRTPRQRREVDARFGQQRFRFRVIKRYGPRCAVCDMDVIEVLDAVHLRPIKENGTNHPMNGMVLCAVHHRALDANMYAIEPQTLRIHSKQSGPSMSALSISRSSLEHLPRKPHQDALDWFWQRWNRG